MNPKTGLYVIANNTKQKSNLSTCWSYVLVYELVAWWRWLVLSFIKQHVVLFLPFSFSVNYKEYKNKYMTIFLQEFHCYAIYSCVITRKCTFFLFICLFVLLYQLARILIVTSSSLPFFTNLIWVAHKLQSSAFANENLPLPKVLFKTTKSQAQANHLEMFLLAGNFQWRKYHLENVGTNFLLKASRWNWLGLNMLKAPLFYL